MASVLSEVDTGAEGNEVPPMEDGAEGRSAAVCVWHRWYEPSVVVVVDCREVLILV